MANRSYLYTTDHLPGSPEWMQRKDLRSIGEFRYDIPLAFRILLSGSPVAVRSSIWESPEPLAIAGDARIGVARLMAYLDRLPAQAAPLVAETRAFFADPDNVRRHFVLECGEIFDLSPGDLAEKNEALLGEIAAITDDVAALELPQPMPEPSLVRRWLAKALKLPPADPLDAWYAIGLGSWANILYYEFSAAEA